MIKAILLDAGGVLYLSKQGKGFLNSELVEFIRANKEQYQFGVISTTNYDLDTILKKDGIRELFNLVLTSGTTNMDKADTSIYQEATRTLGILPEEIVFIDNEKSYTKVAEFLGIKTILYENFEVCHKQLLQLLNS